MKIFLVLGYISGLGLHNWIVQCQFIKGLFFAENIIEAL